MVIFHKSSLIGINVYLSFLQLAEGIFHYKIETLPFRYLVLLVGANPRLESTLEPLLNLVRKLLNSWSPWYVNLKGMIILLNFVLNVVHVFFLFFSFLWKCGRSSLRSKGDSFGVGWKGCVKFHGFGSLKYANQRSLEFWELKILDW